MRRILRGISSFLFPIALLGLVGTSVFALSFANPNNAKGWLKESGVYEKAVENILDLLPQSESQQKRSAFDDPQIKTAIKSAFPPEYLRELAENFIDGSYRWLNGKVSQPDYRLDLSPARDRFVSASGEIILNHLNTLPACPKKAPAQDLSDPLTMTCMPAGITKEQLVEKVKSELAGSELFKNTIITAQPVDEKAKDLAASFKIIRFGPLFFGALGLMTGAGLILFDENKRRGWKRIWVALLSTGILFVINGLLVETTVSRAKTLPFLSQNEKKVAEEIALPLVKLAAQDIAKVYLISGVILIAASVTIWFILRRTKPKTTLAKQ